MTDRIEPASAGDVAAVAAIEREVFTDPWAESAFAGLLGRPHVYFAVAHPASGTATSGYVVAIFAGGEGEIANLAVAPDARGRGLGARLVDAVFQEAGRRDTEALYLEVRESNAAARHLYGTRGFEEVGRRRGYYRRPVEDALILRRSVGPRLT
ncbi:MAG: ribosomal protein S18-alanine N-acetyltransferase [Gemmatimonadota bacterium]|nr:ribosomal protein S18-alanine N-acetyltransferase [Gemmatimonadota bacterium]HEU4989962.1 ribosomal protein S18-alanine N-acetyltransferase [Gemmatimonadaceae bacterium]